MPEAKSDNALQAFRYSSDPAAADPVLIIGNFLSDTTGAHSASEDLALALSDAGRKVLTTSRQKRRTLRLLDMLTAVIRHRRQYEVAVVNVFSGPAFFWAEATSKLLRMCGKKIVLALHGGSLPQFAERYPDRVRRLFSLAAVVIAPSEYLASGMRNYRPDIQVIPNGIFIERYPVAGDKRKPPTRLLWLRAFHQIYNPSMAVEVLALVRCEFPEVTLEMVGPDKGDGSLEKCRSRAADLGVLDAVRFPGAVTKDEVPEVLNRGDMFLNTSSIDNTPVSVIEAMASGLCVVSTAVGGIPYLLKSEYDALLVPRGDAAAMAAAILRLLRNPEDGRALAANARARVEGFDFHSVTRQWSSVLEAARTCP